MYRTLLTVPAAILALGLSAYALEDRVLELPGDYATSYDNYYVSDRLYQDDQVISLYANDVVRDAARAGQALPDGSILVGEIYAAKKDADGEVIEGDGWIIRSCRRCPATRSSTSCPSASTSG